MELRGIGVSPGIAVGPALIVEREMVPVLRISLRPADVPAERERLRLALDVTRGQLRRIRDRLSREVGRPHAYIFDAQLLMLDDPLLGARATELIEREGVNSEWALRLVADELDAQFEAFSDGYLRERRTDVDDVIGRIQLNLAGSDGAPSLSHLPGSFVLVTEDLSPSEAAELDWEHVLAVAINAGSRTSHTAILARSLGIPAVVGLRDATGQIPPGATVVLDGGQGALVVDPPGPALAGYRAAQQRDREEEHRLRETRSLAAETADGVTVHLRANVEFPEEAATALSYGAEGIGLFRSEFLLGRHRATPSEERQVEVYSRLLESLRPHPVTVRLWDLGADDLLPGGPSSPNPALGQRALRMIARAPEPFRIQLRALLRASSHGNLRVMFPFVAGVADLREALEFVAGVRRELVAEGLDRGDAVAFGVNLEVPSAALCVDLLAGEVDFFSIGTNDLIQYLLAVDRSDPRVAERYAPLHPAVLRTVRGVVDAAESRGVPVSLCGEMASEPLHALALLGLGLRDLSMRPAAIPRVKAALRSVTEARARDVVRTCLELATPEAVEQALRRELAPALGPRSREGVSSGV